MVGGWSQTAGKREAAEVCSLIHFSFSLNLERLSIYVLFFRHTLHSFLFELLQYPVFLYPSRRNFFHPKTLDIIILPLLCLYILEFFTKFTICSSLHVLTRISHRLLQSSRRTSSKSLTSVPSYLGYLVLRQLWASESIPVLIVDRHFCGKGLCLCSHASIRAKKLTSSHRVSCQLLSSCTVPRRRRRRGRSNSKDAVEVEPY